MNVDIEIKGRVSAEETAAIVAALTTLADGCDARSARAPALPAWRRAALLEQALGRRPFAPHHLTDR